MNQKQKCIILSLCLRIASPRKPWEFYLSYTTVEGEGDKGGEGDKILYLSGWGGAGFLYPSSSTLGTCSINSSTVHNPSFFLTMDFFFTGSE